MRQDERDLAFAGGGLDRAAHLRGDAGALAALMADPRARVLPFWRGRPLLADAGEGGRRLGLLAPGHPVLAGAGAPLLLGLAAGAARLAVDLSGWEPVGEVALPGSFFDPTEQRHPDLPDDHRFAELRGVMLALDPLEAELAATGRSLLAWHGTHGFCSACGAASEVAKAGWQRNCAACGAQHFPRTDPVVIMLVTRGNRTLIGRSPGWPEGMYSCLAGFMEPGETLEAAVRREVAEETGVEVGAVRFVASQPWPFPSSLMLGCRGEALTEELVLDPVEIEDALWLTREEMAAVFAGVHPVVRSPRRGAIAAHLLRMWLADRLD
ncbi:NAD(+) diphosphatase [Frigidibacter mobilis]|uniref:NAD(+) diphosphatase n=1 Tax=Frigidibacter mobilis TaxID=1335048 RepID=A0A161HD43_9RHOB|nr:NAD(+) diphosphatase [Frigidibacter mobilis]AMY71949.1 NUDIX hydrolase [Frigidibacter mobilis]